MGNPYTSVSVVSYNANPPPDDASHVAGNLATWAAPKTKLTDPLKTAIEAVNTNVNSAFGKVVGGAGITSTATNYGVGAADQGALIRATASSITITTPDSAVVGSPFVFALLNNSAGTITFDGFGAQTINGQANLTIQAGLGLFCFTDGTNWFTAGSFDPTSNFAAALITGTGFKVGSNPTATPGKLPTVQNLTIGTGATFTPTAGTTSLKVHIIGAGGGGAGTGAGGAGGNTTFNSIVANGGAAGGVSSSSAVGAGGAGGTGGTGTASFRVDGNRGGSGPYITQTGGAVIAGILAGGDGAAAPGPFGGGVSSGVAAAANSGAGGGGKDGGVISGSPSTSQSGGGGGSGEYAAVWLVATTYTYTITAGGTAGAGGGFAGGSGRIVVEEFYN